MTSSSVCAALEKNNTDSHVEVCPWEKPVGLLQSRDRRELICMPWRQPVSRAWGNRGSQIGRVDKRCFHTPIVVSLSEMLNRTSNAVYAHHQPGLVLHCLLTTVTTICLEVYLVPGFSAAVNS